MKKRLRTLGIVLSVIGIGFVAAGGVAFAKVQGGYDALQGFSEAQNVELTYNEDGQLTDRGTTEGADAIMALLTEDWKYPVVAGDREQLPVRPVEHCRAGLGGALLGDRVAVVPGDARIDPWSGDGSGSG